MVEGGEVEGGGIDSFYEKQKGGVPLSLALSRRFGVI